MFNRLYSWLLGTSPAIAASPSKSIGPTGQARLTAFQQQMKTKEAAYLSELEIWKKHREIEFSTASSALQHLDVHDPAVHQKIRGIFKELGEIIKRWTIPARWELALLFKDAKPHLDELKDHLNELDDTLQNYTSLDAPDEIKKTRIYICDTSIILLNELVVLINDVLKELGVCLTFKDGIETGLNLTLDILCDDMLKFFESLPAPKFNLDLTNVYQDFLYGEIEEDKNDLEREEEQLEGALQRAEKLLEATPSSATNTNSFFKGPKKSDETREDQLVISSALK